MNLRLSRRGLLGAVLASGASAALPATAMPTFMAAPVQPSAALMARALAALESHPGDFVRDVMAVVDFDAPSAAARFNLVNLVDGGVTRLLVAHGRGSDPDQSGWVRRLSNDPGSAASSAGAYRTDSFYIGKHGRSLRVAGLDPTNSNAKSREIVVHGAWYVSDQMVRNRGKLGRSEGCFALDEAVLPEVLDRLGQGRLIFADRIGAQA